MGTGAKSVYNAAADTAVGIPTLGTYSARDIGVDIEVTQWDLDVGYETSNFIARGSCELAAGVFTGSVSTVSKAGKVVFIVDAAGNAASVARGGVSIYQDGLNWGNAAQTVGGAAGLSGNWAGAFSKASPLDKARHAQVDYSEVFSSKGIEKYSDMGAGRIIMIDDLVDAIKNKQIMPDQVPIDYIRRGRNVLIINTRSSAALKRAGVPRNRWRAIDRTGDSLFEGNLSRQLERNGLTDEGFIGPISQGIGLQGIP